MLRLKSVFAQKLSEAITAAFPDAALSPQELLTMLEYPPDSTLGDVAFPCFKLSKTLRCAPPKIAQSVCEKLGDIPECSRVGADGGYINFKISDDCLASSVLPGILSEGSDYGRNELGKGKTVVLDYASPNVAKPFHIGHLGTTVIGHSLKLIHQFCGYKCIGINHLGDWGTQFGKLICAYRLWGNREEIENGGIDALVALYVKFHAEAEKDETLNDRARAEFKKLEEHDEENTALWKWFIDISLREYEVTFKQLGITFDSYNGESFYTDKMPEQIEKLREMKLLKIDDGASVVDLEEYGMPPCLILKKDGSTLYPTRDIAAALYRTNQKMRFHRCTDLRQCLSGKGTLPTDFQFDQFCTATGKKFQINRRRIPQIADNFFCCDPVGIYDHTQTQFIAQQLALLGIVRIPNSGNRIFCAQFFCNNTAQHVQLIRGSQCNQ